MRLLGDGESLPDLFSRGGVQGHQRSTGRTALVLVAQSDLLATGHRHEDPAVIVFESAYDLGPRMRIDTHLPQQLAGSGVHRVGSGALVAEKCCVSLWLARELGDKNSRSSRRLGLVGPILASGACVQRIDLAVGAGHKYAAADYRRLSPGKGSVGEGEGPLQLQPWYLICAEAGSVSRLKAGIVESRRPSIPTSAFRSEWRLSVRACRRWSRLGAAFLAERFTGQILGDGAALCRA